MKSTMVMKRLASLLPVALAACLAQTIPEHAVGDPLGFYVGAGVGASHIRQDFFDNAAGGARSPTADRLGWKLFAGLRPLSYFGGQLEYVDFGAARLGPAFVVTENGIPLLPDEFYGSHSDAKAAAVFAVGYLPLRRFDLYGRLGVTHLWTHLSSAGNYPNSCIVNPTLNTCVPIGRVSFSQTNNDNGLGYGVGVQARFGLLAIRTEYQRISSPVGDPSHASIDLIWRF